MTLEIVNAVACTINNETIVIEKSMIVNVPLVINYAPRVVLKFEL
jgi:hypothetical protein